MANLAVITVKRDGPTVHIAVDFDGPTDLTAGTTDPVAATVLDMLAGAAEYSHVLDAHVE